MDLTILSVAFPFAPVTHDPVGGAEQVLAQLDRALVAAGHRSIVIAVDGSTVAGDLVALTVAPGEVDDRRRAAVHAELRDVMARTIAANDVDLVHLHGIDFGAYLPTTTVPTLATLHLPIDWYDPAALGSGRPSTWLLPVSGDQAARAPADIALLPPIANGVDIDDYRPTEARGDYALVLGRMAPEKGFHDAIDAAKAADIALVAAGQLFPYADHQRYFDEQVAPRLDDRRRWIGPVTGAAKRRLIAEARCLLVPSTAAETSSLVAMEALASGTPVIAYRAGALPEIVEDGVTGIVVDDVAGMAEAIRAIDRVDPAACRRAARARFSLQRTTAAYLDLYARLAA